MSHSAAVEYDGELYIFGGVSNIDSTNDLTVINLTTMESRVLQPKEKGDYWPPPLDSHTAVLDPASKKIYVFGGLEKYRASSHLYEYSIETGKWRRVETKGGPAPRSCHSAVFYSGRMVVFGGINADGDTLGDMWELAIDSLTWSQVVFKADAKVPDPRYGHTTALNGKQLYLFGGIVDPDVEVNEFWKFDMDAKTWEEVHASYRPDDPLERDTPTTAMRMLNMRKQDKMKRQLRMESSFRMEKSDSKDAKKSPQGADKQYMASHFTLNKSESAKELPSMKRKKAADIGIDLYKTQIPREPMSPVSVTMSNSIVLRSYAKQSLKDMYKGPAQKEEGEIASRLPCARDGHVAVFNGGRMYVFGGDRYKMSFSDLHFYLPE